MYSQGVKVLIGVKHYILDWKKLRSKNRKSKQCCYHSFWFKLN